MPYTIFFAKCSICRRKERENPNIWWSRQHSNPANVASHRDWTAREILEMTDGKLDGFVASIGTGGTLMGAGRRLREYNRSIQVIGIEPIKGHKIQGLKNMQESYPPGIFHPEEPDAIVHVDDQSAYETARRLAREEGILSGISCGAATAVAIRLAKLEEFAGKTIVVVLPDSGERYLSTVLFEGIG